jgi:secreted trypsin-like serine protease
MLIIGFGATQFEGKVSPVLREVQSNVVPAEACKEAYRKAKINVDAATLLCTGVAGGGKGSCQGTYALATLRSVISSSKHQYVFAGDSGGPIFSQGPNGSLVLVATISWGKGCARYEMAFHQKACRSG